MQMAKPFANGERNDATEQRSCDLNSMLCLLTIQALPLLHKLSTVLCIANLSAASQDRVRSFLVYGGSMNNSVFLTVTAALTLVSLFLEYKNIFPEHTQIRRAIVLLSIGILAGVFLSSVFDSGIRLNLDLSAYAPLQILAFAITACIAAGAALAGLLGILHPDPIRRKELSSESGSYGFAFLLFVMFLGSTINADSKLTTPEVVALAAYHETNGRYEAAIKYYERLSRKYKKGDARRTGIEDQINELKKRMAENFSAGSRT